MFRSSSLESNTPIDNNSAINGLGGFNMYLDTSITHNMSPPMSSATMSPPTTPLTPEPTMASTQFPLLTDNNQLNTALLQRQYQYHLLIQHHQQQLALAQHQLALAASAAAASHQQNDEIAHSLKMFALLTACNADSSSVPTQDVMQDFASNGYASDDLNRFQYSNQSCPTSQPLQSQMPRQQYANSTTGASTSSSAAAEVTAAHLFNLNNYREHLSNVWRSMTMGYMPNNNIAASPGIPMASGSIKNINPVGMAMPSDHMRNVSNVNISNKNNNNRQQKRFNNQKSKEHVHRHCVFCENNNEPEAVVNSHSVRDNYGRVLCPKLRTYVCPICGASGDSAHTIKYCPKKPIVTMEDAIKAESFRLAKGNYYKQQMKV